MPLETRIVQTPSGTYRTYPVRILRVNPKRKRPALSESALERNKRITDFWGATAKKKHERRSNAIRIARRGPLSASVEAPCLFAKCQCTAILPRLHPPVLKNATSLDDIPANHVARIERWSGKTVQIKN